MVRGGAEGIETGTHVHQEKITTGLGDNFISPKNGAYVFVVAD